MEISIAQNVAGQIQALLQISCIFFANWFAFFLQFFRMLILAIKMDLHCLHYFCIFLHPDFWGSIFQLHVFCIFCIYIFFYVSQEEAQPDHTKLVPKPKILERQKPASKSRARAIPVGKTNLYNAVSGCAGSNSDLTAVIRSIQQPALLRASV